MNPPTVGGCDFIETETIQAGNFSYKTDRLRGNFDGNIVVFNHIDIECPNCHAISELAIDYPDALRCPICDASREFWSQHLASATLIHSNPSE